MLAWLLLGVTVSAGLTTHSVADNSSNVCHDGLIVPIWLPQENVTTEDRVTRGGVYVISLLYLFLGVSIISNRLICAIEIITSREKKVVITVKNGVRQKQCVRVWNETVANLTLVALGSSAPEIMLTIIELYAKNFEYGDLGPGILLGSAAYRLFVNVAFCIFVVPEGENRKIKKLGVFVITATWSVFAYLWLYTILAVISVSVIEIWEGVLTFLFFPATVFTAYIGSRCSASDAEVDLKDTEILGDTLEQAKSDYSLLLRDLKKQHPKKEMEELEQIAEHKVILSGPKSRAYYRIMATRGITGKILRKNYKNVPYNKSDKHISLRKMPSGTFYKFEQATYTVVENIGSVRVAVVREGTDTQQYIILDYCTQDGTAKAGRDFVKASGTLVFKPGESKKTIDIRIIDDVIFETEEHFFVHLTELHIQDKSNLYIKLTNPKTAKIVILDDDHTGEFSFEKEIITVRESESVFELPVVRKGGARGVVRVPYWTMDGTAEAGVDYIEARGYVEFVDNDTRFGLTKQSFVGFKV